MEIYVKESPVFPYVLVFFWFKNMILSVAMIFPVSQFETHQMMTSQITRSIMPAAGVQISRPMSPNNYGHESQNSIGLPVTVMGDASSPQIYMFSVFRQVFEKMQK